MKQDDYIDSSYDCQYDVAYAPPNKNKVISPLEIALKFARDGIPVFPCREQNSKNEKGEIKKAKSPYFDYNYLKNGVKDATTDEKIINFLFSKFPNALVGIPMGRPSKLLCVDIDVDIKINPAGTKEIIKNSTALQLFSNLLDAHSISFNEITRINTPSGGYQVWYRIRDDQLDKVDLLTNKVKDKFNLDIRSNGGYAIAPGSHIISYEKAIYGGDYEQIGENFEELPDWLLDELLSSSQIKEGNRENKKANIIDETIEEKFRFTYDIDSTERGKNILKKTLRKLEVEGVFDTEGKRNNTLFETTIYLFRVSLAGELNSDEVVSGLNNLIQHSKNPLPYEEICKIIDNCKKYAIQDGPYIFKNNNDINEYQDILEENKSIEDFPYGIFTNDIDRMIDDISCVKNIPRGNVVSVLLSWLAKSLGAKFETSMKKNDEDPQACNLYIVLCASSSQGKSPLKKLFDKHLKKIQSGIFAEYRNKCLEVQKKKEENPEKNKKLEFPQMPVGFGTTDFTIESLRSIFQIRPYIIIEVDEVLALFKSFDAYRQNIKNQEGRGKELLCSLWDGRYEMITNRASKEKNAYIPNCWLSIYGGIQVERFQKLFVLDDLLMGLLGRFIIIFDQSPNKKKEITNLEISEETINLIDNLTSYFIQLQPEKSTPSEEFKPQKIEYSDEARDYQIDWYNNNLSAKLFYENKNTLVDKISKNVSRIALIIHIIKAYENLSNLYTNIDLDTIKRACRFGDWLTNHMIYACDLVSNYDEENFVSFDDNEKKLIEILAIGRYDSFITKELMDKFNNIIDKELAPIELKSFGKLISRLKVKLESLNLINTITRGPKKGKNATWKVNYNNIVKIYKSLFPDKAIF